MSNGELKLTLNDLLQVIELMDVPEEREALLRQIATKSDRFVHFVESAEAQANMLKDRASRINSAAKALLNAAESTRSYAKTTMLNNGVNEIHGDEWTMTLSKGAPKLVVDESIIEDKFKIPVISYDIDKELIKKELSENKVIGARLEPVYRLLYKPRRKQL